MNPRPFRSSPRASLLASGFLLTLSLLVAQDAAPPASPAAEAPAAAAPAKRPPPDTHGVDMRTQAGPPGARYSPPVPLDDKLPTFWLIGDSTVRNGTAGDGTNMNQWGWGAPLTFYFDPLKVNVVNRALGGTSARSFYNSNWKAMVDLIKPGDVVILQFGTNDGGNPASSVGEIKGLGDETRDITNRAGKPETVHTFGWYLRQYLAETRAKGATPIVCSLIPRKSWDDHGHINRARDSFAGWAGQVAQAEKVGFIDLNELIARRLDALGKEKTDLLYVPNPTPEKPRGETVHPGWDGAVLNAEVVVSGLKALPENPVAAYFSDKAKAVAPATESPGRAGVGAAAGKTVDRGFGAEVEQTFGRALATLDLPAAQLSRVKELLAQRIMARQSAGKTMPLRLSVEDQQAIYAQAEAEVDAQIQAAVAPPAYEKIAEMVRLQFELNLIELNYAPAMAAAGVPFDGAQVVALAKMFKTTYSDVDHALAATVDFAAIRAARDAGERTRAEAPLADFRSYRTKELDASGLSVADRDLMRQASSFLSAGQQAVLQKKLAEVTRGWVRLAAEKASAPPKT